MASSQGKRYIKSTRVPGGFFKPEMFFLLLIGLAAAVPSPATSDDTVRMVESAQSLQEYRKVCRGTKYSTACLKGDMIKVLRMLSVTPPYQIFPGVTVSSSGLTSRSNVKSNFTSVDALLADTLTDYIRSLTLHVAIYNQEALDFIYAQHKALEGRGKKFKFLSIYTVFAIAFALLSALVGKAMTLSIVSLVIALIARNVGNNSPPNNPPVTYDIVRRPQVQFANTHSQEDIYEGAHSGMPISYVYPRVTARSSADPYKAYRQKLKNSTSRKYWTGATARRPSTVDED